MTSSYAGRASQHWMVLAGVLGVLACVGGAPTPLYSGVAIRASLEANATTCYHFALDPNTTREVVYWPMAKLHVRLSPCSGTPHLRASVHGCPSEGHVVNFEFQNTKSRNDMKAKNMTVPPQWEWMGDTETLSLDVTHRNFYIEVTQFHPPLRTNETKADLVRRLRQKKLDKQADVVDDMIFKGKFGRDEAVQLRALQEMVMPTAHYELIAYLHDNKAFPEEKLTPLASTPGFKRDVEHLKPEKPLTPDDPLFGAYVVAFHPPTWKPITNGTNATTTSTVNATAGSGATMRSDMDMEVDGVELPHHHRRLLALHEEGTKDVTWGDVEELLAAEPWAAEELSAARALLSPEDVIFYAHPGAANARRGSEPPVTGRQLHSLKLSSPEHPQHKEAVAEEQKRQKILGDTEERLSQLAKHPEYAEAVRRGEEELAKRKYELVESIGRRSTLTTRAITNASFSDTNETASGSRELTLKEKADRPLIDEELEYLIYWVDITKFVQNRWGFVEDALKNKYTRLFDFNASGGFYCPEESKDRMCGIHQLIAREEFARLDKLGNGDGRLQRSELYAEFPPDGNAAFRTGWDWDKAVAYQDKKMLSGDGLSMRAWEEAYGKSQAIFDASFKDPLLRNYWTVCGLNRSATPLVPSGNITKDASRFEWLGYKAFDRDAKGRLTRGIKGLADHDNNVYIVNVVARHTVTKEMVAYKPHVLQRRSPIYEAADTTGPQSMALIYGVAGTVGGITLIFIMAIIYSRTRKTRPKLRVVKHGPAGPLMAQM